MDNFGTISNQNAGDLKTVADIHRFLATEVNTCQGFASNLMKEFHEIEDLQKNLAVIQDQIRYIELLAQKKDEIIQALARERRQQRTKINLQQCNQFLQMISQVDRELKPMIAKAIEELARLFLHETHELYIESEVNRRAMKNIDDATRKLHASLEVLESRVHALDTHIERASKELAEIEGERLFRAPKKPISGFGQP